LELDTEILQMEMNCIKVNKVTVEKEDDMIFMRPSPGLTQAEQFC